ncbi:MAG: leucine-rich repeat protein [Bacteroidaceae bacterium]|nr:leucine-rich repeat protein [Bacteroidaceae bacterium]
MMRRGTKLGWALIGLSVIICGWTIAGTTITDAEGEMVESVEAVVESVAEESPAAEIVSEPEAVAAVEEAQEPSMEMLMALNADAGISLAMEDRHNDKYDVENNVVTIKTGTITAGDELDNNGDISKVIVDANASGVVIKDNAFSGCGNITEIDLGSATVENFADTFGGCVSLNTVKGTNYTTEIQWSVQDQDKYKGVVYSDNGEKIVYVLKNAGYTDSDTKNYLYIPNTVKSIDLNAFKDSDIAGIYVMVDDDDEAINSSLLTALKEGASAKGITFIPKTKGTSPINPIDPDPDKPDPVTPTPTSTPGGGGTGGGGSSGGGSSSGGSGGGSSSDGSGVSTTVTYTVTADGQVVKGHTQSATPKTADGFDERYLLSLSIFFCGLGFILYSRNKKYTMISELSDRD